MEIVIKNKEYLPMIEDITRMLTIQVILQFLYFINTDDTPFFSWDFILLLVYVALGVCVYWLIIKRVLIFK